MAAGAAAAYNAAVETFREREYPMLKDSVYLDHAGSTLCSKSLMDSFAADMTSTLYGNPHSASWPSQLSSARIDDIRLRLLSFFGADPAEFDLVFVANATAGVKLVVEAMRSLPHGYLYAYHRACHTSLVGAREDARGSVCLGDDEVDLWIQGRDPFPHCAAPPSASAALFSFSAQSHLDGQRYPLGWAKSLKDKAAAGSRPVYTLLDAASLSATSQLELGARGFAADFIVLSLYKIFGFPDLGALIVRQSAAALFDRRRYFGGGTVDIVVCVKEQWHAPKTQSLHERLEDGTLPFHSIMAIDAALTTHQRLFGTMHQVGAHTRYLSSRLGDQLRGLQHGNGRPVCVVYTEPPREGRPRQAGPIVSFNLVSSEGAWISLAEFEKMAMLKKMHVRTGGLCCPGGVSSALGLQPWEMRRNFSAGFRCGGDDDDVIAGKPTGVIRASLGAMSIASDVERFVDFIREFFVEEARAVPPARPALGNGQASPELRVKAITVYPIKSCAGFAVPQGTRWHARPEGLAWDREWCLVHRGSRQALSQKRYPRMALLRPSLDLDRGVMWVYFGGAGQGAARGHVTIPLSAKPDLFDQGACQRQSRVCGEEVSAQAYVSNEINGFFTDALGVPCVLARFPAGGRGLGSRTIKARMQKHQQPDRVGPLPGAFPDMPSPPDSDSEQRGQGRILLSNESPMLLVHRASVDALNQEIERRGGEAVRESAFRPNIVVEGLPGAAGRLPYSEDSWSGIRIGDQDFAFLGACRRCHMVCVDQATGERRQEPYSTLAKTRRLDGVVYFGAHMRHVAAGGKGAVGQRPSVGVGDLVTVYDERDWHGARYGRRAPPPGES